MRSAEGVPKREGGVVALPCGQGVDLRVHAAVLAIDVIEELRPERHVVEGGVEDPGLRRVGDGGVDSRELGAPGSLRRGPGLVEVETGLLGGQIFPSTLGGDTGDAGADEDGLVSVGAEVQNRFEVVAFDLAANLDRLVIRVEDDFVRLARELHGEVAVAIVAPGPGNVASGEGVLGRILELGRVYGGTTVGEVAVAEVDDEPGVFTSGKGVAVDAGTLGAGELHLDLGIGKEDGVEAGFRDFGLMREAGAVAGIGVGAGAGHKLDRAGAGHHEEVQQVAAAGAAEMRVAEAHDGGVGDVVAGAPVPPIVEGIGAELHGGEGNAGPGKAVTMAPGADMRIDVAQNVGGGVTRRGQGRGGKSSRGAKGAGGLEKATARDHVWEAPNYRKGGWEAWADAVCRQPVYTTV